MPGGWPARHTSVVRCTVIPTPASPPPLSPANTSRPSRHINPRVLLAPYLMNLRDRARPSPASSPFLSAAPTWRNSSKDPLLVLGRDANSSVPNRDLDGAVRGSG